MNELKEFIMAVVTLTSCLSILFIVYIIIDESKSKKLKKYDFIPIILSCFTIFVFFYLLFSVKYMSFVAEEQRKENITMIHNLSEQLRKDIYNKKCEIFLSKNKYNPVGICVGDNKDKNNSDVFLSKLDVTVLIKGDFAFTYPNKYLIASKTVPYILKYSPLPLLNEMIKEDINKRIKKDKAGFEYLDLIRDINICSDYYPTNPYKEDCGIELKVVPKNKMPDNNVYKVE